MRIVSMGDGISDDTQAYLDDTQAYLEGKPCIVLLADSREELSAAMQGLSILESVTVVARAMQTGSKESNG